MLRHTTHLLLGDLRFETQSCLYSTQLYVVWRYIERREEISLCLPMPHTTAILDLSSMHMTRDWRDLWLYSSTLKKGANFEKGSKGSIGRSASGRRDMTAKISC